jgi:3-methyladenine DNA glycosylase AlkD
MTTKEVLKELEGYADANTKKVLMKHGAKEPFFGVKVADLKKILKKTKKNHELSLALYKTGNSDAMYLAGLMADENKISKKELQEWVEGAYWYYISEFAVPWVAAETPFGFKLGLEWIKSKKENVQAAGWSTLSSYASLNENVDIKTYEKLLKKAEEKVHKDKNRVSYAINNFIIAVGTYIPELSEKAKAVGARIGKVKVDMGEVKCNVPLAEDKIDKVIEKGRVGVKRKTARC